MLDSLAMRRTVAIRLGWEAPVPFGWPTFSGYFLAFPGLYLPPAGLSFLSLPFAKNRRTRTSHCEVERRGRKQPLATGPLRCVVTPRPLTNSSSDVHLVGDPIDLIKAIDSSNSSPTPLSLSVFFFALSGGRREGGSCPRGHPRTDLIFFA